MRGSFVLWQSLSRHLQKCNLYCVSFADVFPSKLPPGLPVCVTDYRIVLLPDYKPFTHWLYRMFPEEDKELNAQLDQYSADGYIAPARIARVAVTSSAMKKDGGLRHCFDYMALTSTTFQELTNYWMASKAPMSSVKRTFNKVLFRFGFFPNMWMAQHFRRNLNPINSR